MNFAWPVLKSWQSTLGLQSICSVESTSYSYHRIYSSCKKRWKETENRNGSIEISSQPQLIPTIKKKDSDDNHVHDGNCFPVYRTLYISNTSRVVLC